MAEAEILSQVQGTAAGIWGKAPKINVFMRSEVANVTISAALPLLRTHFS